MTSDGQFDLNLALKLIDKFDGTGAKTAVDDFAASVKYYSDVLGKGSEENAKLQRKELIDFIMRIKLKGEARDLFTRHHRQLRSCAMHYAKGSSQNNPCHNFGKSYLILSKKRGV